MHHLGLIRWIGHIGRTTIEEAVRVPLNWKTPMSPRIALAGLCAIGLIGCAGEKPANNRDTMTQRQKDSVFGQSGVPGAAAIPKAQRAADSLNAARKRQDSAMAKPDTTSD
jgi:hypothetical protein